MKKILLSVLCFLPLFISCGKDDEPSTPDVPKPSDTQTVEVKVSSKDLSECIIYTNDNNDFYKATSDLFLSYGYVIDKEGGIPVLYLSKTYSRDNVRNADVATVKAELKAQAKEDYTKYTNEFNNLDFSNSKYTNLSGSLNVNTKVYIDNEDVNLAFCRKIELPIFNNQVFNISDAQKDNELKIKSVIFTGADKFYVLFNDNTKTDEYTFTRIDQILRVVDEQGKSYIALSLDIDENGLRVAMTRWKGSRTPDDLIFYLNK